MVWFVKAVCAVAEVIFLTMICDSFFDRRDESIGRAVLFYTVFGVWAVVLALVPGMGLLRVGFWIVAGAALVRANYEAGPVQAVLSCLLLLLICVATDTLVRVLLHSLFDVEEQAMARGGEARVSYIIICHLFYLLFVVLVRLAEGLASGRVAVRALLPACPSLAVGILFSCLLVSEISGEGEIAALGLLYTSIVVILFTTRMQEQEKARRDLELANQHYATQKAYYEQLHAQQEQTRALWHDLDKYLHAARAEGASGPSLDQLRERMSAVAPVVDVDNQVVSIILNEYAQSARAAKTELDLDVQLPEELPVSAADLYIVLGNTLDNALEACARLPEPERRISLQIRMHNQMLFYKLSNPCGPESARTRPREGHGYGLRNVQACARRHQGSVQIGREAGTYTVTVLMNL